MSGHDEGKLVRLFQDGEARTVHEWTEAPADIERTIADTLGIPHSEVLVTKIWTTSGGMGVRFDIFGIEVSE